MTIPLMHPMQGTAPMPYRNLRRERRSAVAVLFAIMAVPLIATVGLAIDYGFWCQTYASMSLAASGAALNAVKTTAAATIQNDPNAVSEGQTAGKQWFIAQLGTISNAAHISVSAPTVNVTTGVSTTAQVTYTAQMPSIFGGSLFGIKTYPVTVTAAAEVVTSPYLNVEILLDNSGSMEIGATPGDIAAMMYLTPCSSAGAVYSNTGSTGGTVAVNAASSSGLSAQQWYNAYSCKSTNTYDGQLSPWNEETCPISSVNGVTLTKKPLGFDADYTGPQLCSNLPPQKTKATNYPGMGAPCAFACHWDTTNQTNDAVGNDYYGLARSTLAYTTPCYNTTNGLNCYVTTRFDLVKEAVNQVITTMQSDNITAINNLNVGIYWFATDVNQVYPSVQPGNPCAPIGGVPNNTLACQAGNQWSTAQNLVGTPPKTPGTADPGIQPFVGPNGADSDMQTSMNDLATKYLTSAGDGSSPSAPLKVLFLVTDGLADYVDSSGNRQNQAINPNWCAAFKNMGYTVYVLYTPYYPLMNAYYLGNIYSIAEGSGSGSLGYNLQQCSSDPNHDYIAANPTDSTSIDTALEAFLKRALTSPARFTD